mmetsp:Transcript_23167/g.50166  ORF Transcript_23167/g.50166 Transcript_23167/m.50166 type:complete len:443 (+) Transcript_23167:144-1472(+)
MSAQPPVAKDDTTPAEEEGGWGLSSVSAAFDGWGLTTYNSSGPTTAAEEPDEGKGRADITNNNLILSTQAEEVLDETAKIATRAAFSFFDDASDFLSSAAAQIIEESAAAAAAAGVSSSGGDVGEPSLVKEEQSSALVQPLGAENTSLQTAACSIFEDASKIISSAYTNDNSAAATTEEGASQAIEGDKDALSSFLDYNPLNSLASRWIIDLEQKSNANDPHCKLRDHLESYLVDWPKSTYEEWVEDARLTVIEGWDHNGSEFYTEKCVHRNIWNERMAILYDPNAGGGDEKEAGDEGGKGADSSSEWRSRYVPAGRSPQKEKVVVAAPIASSPSKDNTSASPNEGATPNSKKRIEVKSAAVSAAKSNTEDDLDNLLDDTIMLPSTNPSSKGTPTSNVTSSTTPNNNPILEASALLLSDNNEDADLDGLLGNDDEEGEFLCL